MVVVHPLSSVTSPSAFDLETGRLCVMTSRHRAGLIMIARDHIRHTLETHIPAAAQAVGRPDVTGRGHEATCGSGKRLKDKGAWCTPISCGWGSATVLLTQMTWPVRW